MLQDSNHSPESPVLPIGIAEPQLGAGLPLSGADPMYTGGRPVCQQ